MLQGSNRLKAQALRACIRRIDCEYVIGKGTSHGSPYLYDRAVPIIVRAPGRAAAGRVVAAPQSPATFAVTAARLLGVTPPQGARGGASLAR